MTNILFAGLSGALFLSFISPQVSLYGRGLRLALPLFCATCAIAILLRGKATLRALKRHWSTTSMGLAFLGLGIIRNLFETQAEFFQSQIVEPAVCIMLWIAVVLVKSVFPESLEKTRWISLFGLGIGLGMGVPLLIDQPGIARLTMGNPLQDYYASIFYARGVGNYSWYTPVACACPIIASWLVNSNGGKVAKMTGGCCLLLAILSVLLSTFAMAVTILLFGMVVWLSLYLKPLSFKVLPLIIIVSAVLGLIGLFEALHTLGRHFEGIAFVDNKIRTLITGVLVEGPLGEGTGRVWMFLETMKTFMKNPIFGVWGLEPGRFVGGHSSWADMLALQGVLGAVLWTGFLATLWRRKWRGLPNLALADVGFLSWGLLALGGILNPTLHNGLGLMLIWLFDEGGIWRRERDKGK